VSTFGPVTDAERRGWQIRDVAALADLLNAAHKAGLPPIAWHIGHLGGLLGTCTDPNPAQCRAEFDAWAEFIRAQGGEPHDWPEQRVGGRLRLRAGRRKCGPHKVDVAVIADIYDEGEAGE
jgi:hypothetical protein